MDEIAPQILRTASGEELIVLTRAEFEALRTAAADKEDADDAAVFDARMADLKSGLDAALPPEVSALVLKGASLPKALRKWRKLTQTQLASKARIAQGYISDIENGKKAGTPEALAAIAKALEVDRQWLLP